MVFCFGLALIILSLPLRSSVLAESPRYMITQPELVDIFTHHVNSWHGSRLCVFDFADYSPEQRLFAVQMLGLPPHEYIRRRHIDEKTCGMLARTYEDMNYQVRKTPYSIGYNLYGVLYNDSYDVRYLKIIY